MLNKKCNHVPMINNDLVIAGFWVCCRMRLNEASLRTQLLSTTETQPSRPGKEKKALRRHGALENEVKYKL